MPLLIPRDPGVRLQVAVVPNASRTAADGLHDGALKVRLMAPAVEGRANEALVQWIARSLGVPLRCVRVARGAASRRKWVEIDAPVEVVQDWLDRVLAGSGP